MTFCEFLAKIDKSLRNYLVENFPFVSCFLYSYGRKFFLNKLISERPKQVELPTELRTTLWSIQFKSPLFNAAGMFKSGDGYPLACLQSAGAFLAGTVTPNPRKGNTKKGIKHPFLPYPNSLSSSNWMGLPNPGFNVVIQKLNKLTKVPGIPIGLSLAADGTSLADMEVLCLVLTQTENSIVDFVELNESCPNVEHENINYSNLDENFIKRLEYLSDKFLKKRRRNLPVILKLSTDFDPKFVPTLIDNLVEMQFDGINFGNTSTNYNALQYLIHPLEQNSFEFFVKTFGGGVSGRPLQTKSYELTQVAANYLKQKNFSREFHIIRTGGIFEYQDLQTSRQVGVSLFQWFTGYFENFAKFGHTLYQKFFNL